MSKSGKPVSGSKRGGDAPPDVAVQHEHGIADLHLPAEPLVLLVRLDTVDLEQHPEVATVGRTVAAALLAEPPERCGGDERDVAAACTAIGRVLIGPEQRQRPPGNLGDGVLPGTDDAVRGSRIAVHLGCYLVSELDHTFDALDRRAMSGRVRGSPRPIPAG